MVNAVISHKDARCPRCGKLLCKLSPGAAARGVSLWCKGCKRNVELRLENG